MEIPKVSLSGGQPSSSSPIYRSTEEQARTSKLEEWLRNLVKFSKITSSNDMRLECIRNIVGQLDQIISHPQYSVFLKGAVPILTNYLLEPRAPSFLQEHPQHQVRKLVIQVLHRLPSNETLRAHVKTILSAMFKNVEIDNEENTVNCLEIIVELHKLFQPPVSADTHQFLNFVKNVFRDVEGKTGKMFEQKPMIKVKNLSEQSLRPFLDETFVVTSVQHSNAPVGGKPKTLIPKASNSVKVLQDLPIIVVLMHQMYKQSVRDAVAECIPVIIKTISLHPTEAQSASPTFNKEVFTELISAQVKALSFLAYILKLYQDVVVQHSELLVNGTINLLKLCPPELSSLRREVYTAMRHLLSKSELGVKFVPLQKNFLTEELLVGRGWTVNDTMRPIIYCIVADFTHHVRQHLSLEQLAHAVHFFSCQVHDKSFALGFQTMSIRLIFNLVDSIRKKVEEEQIMTTVGRKILFTILEVFAFKSKSVAISAERLDSAMAYDACAALSSNSFSGPSLAERRALMKSLVYGIKTVTWAIYNLRSVPPENPDEQQAPVQKPFASIEVEIFIKLLRWGLKALEVFTVPLPQTGVNTVPEEKPIGPYGIRSKEEKEVSDHFGSVFQHLNPYTFRELFTVCVDVFAERTGDNPAVQVLANNLLANMSTSPIFGSILVEYLLERMEVMGSGDAERSARYLKLFKLVFGSVALFRLENEQMLCPYLHDIVNKALEHATRAKDPLNYFLLLRALFRSIGGGSHELLYQEFLPLLPSLLPRLNSLQSGHHHKQQMKDLLVELCIHVPVRLCNLLPYLPQLMDPLVTALNSSSPLVAQGLRTLELCVDNLDPQLLYEHIQPDLMHALWKIMRTPHQGNATIAFRILGKFGGSNRKILVEPQKLGFHEKSSSSGQCLVLAFLNHRTNVVLPIMEVVSVAVKTLRTANCFPAGGAADVNLHYKKQSWEFLKAFVLSSLCTEPDRFIQNKLLLHGEMATGQKTTSASASFQPQVDAIIRQVLVDALTGWVMATTVKEIRKDVYISLTHILRRFAMIMAAQQVGPFEGKIEPGQMDPYVIFDAMFNALASEEQDLRRPFLFCLSVLLNTITQIVHSNERTFSLPMIDYITEKMCSFCYERPWYAKLGSCEAISFFLDNASMRWVLQNHLNILKALFFVCIDLDGEVAAGAVDIAKANITKLILLACAPHVSQELMYLKAKCLRSMTLQFSKHLSSPSSHVRDQCKRGLELLAEHQGCSITAIMEPHRDTLVDLFPTTKHLLRSQSVYQQIGILDANAFCLSLQPPLFSFDTSINEHRSFLHELFYLAEVDDCHSDLPPCYKSSSCVLVPIKKAVISLLACITNLPEQRNKIIGIFLQHLVSPSSELQKHAFDCIRKFTENGPILYPVPLTAATIRSVLQQIILVKTIDIHLLSHLSYLYQLFPDAIPEKLWDTLLQIFKKTLEIAGFNFQKQPNKAGLHDLKLCVAIVECFHILEWKLGSGLVVPLCRLCLNGEKLLNLSHGSPLRQPLAKFVMKYPLIYLDIALIPPYIMQPEWTHFLLYLIRKPEAYTMREYLMANPTILLNWMNVAKYQTVQVHTEIVAQNFQLKLEEQENISYLAIKIMMVLNNFDEDWINGTGEHKGKVVNELKALWSNPAYQYKSTSKYMTTGPSEAATPAPSNSTSAEECINSAKFEMIRWKEPHMIVELLLSYFKKNTNDYDILFQLLLAFCGRPQLPYHHLKDFLENVLPNYNIAWKRQCFLEFRRIYTDCRIDDELKSKIIQFVLIPCFSHAFELGQGNELIIGYSSTSEDFESDIKPVSILDILINEIIPQKSTDNTVRDHLRITLYQLCCLLLDKVPGFIHQEHLKRLVTFAWPTIVSKSGMDPSVKYYGQLMLSHIAAKFSLNKRIILQVFHGLLKACAQETKAVVKQCLDIITPALPFKVEDGTTVLLYSTKKLLMEEGNSMSQLTHLAELIVRQWKVYYPVRHGLILHLVRAVNRLSITASSTMEQKKLAVDVAEVIVKWELELLNREMETDEDGPEVANRETSTTSGSITTPQMIETIQNTRILPLDTINVSNVLTLLCRIACQVNEPNCTSEKSFPGENLSKRCFTLIKFVLKPDFWKEHANNIKLGWMDSKILSSLDPAQTNYPNVCMALDILTFLIGIMSKEVVLENVKLLQKGLVACVINTDKQVIGAVHSFMTQLMFMFPAEFIGPSTATTSTTMQKYDKLSHLFLAISKVIWQGLNNYAKVGNTVASMSSQSILGVIMMVKAACANNPGYIDRIITIFVNCLQKLCREHLNPTSVPSAADQSTITNLLITSLDLVKNRVGVMGLNISKDFIWNVLVSLIEKSPNAAVMETIIKMLEHWIQNKNPVVVNQGPGIREKSILLEKLMQNVEKRFPGDEQLVAMFFKLVLCIYLDKKLKTSDLASKLEPAFLSGLRCSQPAIREKFFGIVNGIIKNKLYDRLVYMMCTQNWEGIGAHYWIKQCEELVMAPGLLASSEVKLCPEASRIPTVGHGYGLLDANQKHTFMRFDPDVVCELEEHDKPFIQELEMDFEALIICDEEDEAAVQAAVIKLEDAFIKNGCHEPSHNDSLTFAQANLKVILERDKKWSEEVIKYINVSVLVKPLVQLCHLDTQLAEQIWIQFFPRAWNILSDKERLSLANEMEPFLCSGAHLLQQHCSPGALNTFVEAMSRCVPAIPLKPSVMFYLAKTHNLWHRMALQLEQLAFATCLVPFVQTKLKGGSSSMNSATGDKALEVLDSLSQLYSQLSEYDLWTGLWNSRAKYPETNFAIAFEQQGYYEKAQGAYELALSMAGEDLCSMTLTTSEIRELKLLEEHWLNCTKELNQWDAIQEYSTSEAGSNSFMVLEGAWKSGSWELAKDTLAMVEAACPQDKDWKTNLIRGYLAVCSSEDQNLNIVHRYVDAAQNHCIKQWKRLPTLVSNAHIGILQATQQVMELREATVIHQSLEAGHPPETLLEMKNVLNKWCRRFPDISDDLSHWSDIFSWRTHHYQFIANYASIHKQQCSDDSTTTPETLPSVHGSGRTHTSTPPPPVTNEQDTAQAIMRAHALAQVKIHNFAVHHHCQAICHLGKIARKHGSVGVALETLGNIYTIPSVSIANCFQKFKEQVKCYIHQPASQITNRSQLREALEIFESARLQHFEKEMTAEFFALKGFLLTQLGRPDEANKTFSASCQLDDTLAKSWGYWGDYLEQSFMRDPSQVELGKSAITALMQASFNEKEVQSRKYIAKILWLLMYDDEKGSLADVADKYFSGVPAVQWLPWIPQLLTSLVRDDRKMIVNVLNEVGRVYPQALYFPIRTLYLTLKMEQREKMRNGGASTATQQQQPVDYTADNLIKASPSMRRCSKIMHTQRDMHPTVLSSLEGIVDQLIYLRENWSEELLKQLKIGLAYCYSVTFDNRNRVMNTVMPPQLVNFVSKLVGTFGINSQPVQPRSQAVMLRLTQQSKDSAFNLIKTQFTQDFENSAHFKLENLIQKLRKWIKIMESKTKSCAARTLMDQDRSKFLLSFNPQMAEIELPGEFLTPKHVYQAVKIARFLPKMNVIVKHQYTARRLYILGHNGKVYPYLVAHDSVVGEARREERILQLTRMLNSCLGKQKETARRNMRFTAPKLVAVSPHCRLIEDNPTSISLVELFKIYCSEKKVGYDSAVLGYYDHLVDVQAKGGECNHELFMEIFQKIQLTLVPKQILKDWAWSNFTTSSDYWMFRKMFTNQVCLSGFAEHTFHLTRLNPEMMNLHQDSGLVNISYFRFDIEDSSGDLVDINPSRPVPFRLTPNISEFLTPHGVDGPLVGGMIAIARCMMYPNYKMEAILRAVLKEEMISYVKNKCEEPVDASDRAKEVEIVISLVNKAVNRIMSRLTSLSLDVTENKVSTLVVAAKSPDNLCTMDPSWLPWL